MFQCDKVEFVDSDHRVERNYPEYSELIQFIDLLVGAISYCIHVTNRGNLGQRECASRILPLTRDILLDPYAKESPYPYCRQYDIGHFPKDSLTALDEDRVPGEFYRLNCREFEELLSRQMDFGF